MSIAAKSQGFWKPNIINETQCIIVALVEFECITFQLVPSDAYPFGKSIGENMRSPLLASTGEWNYCELFI